MNKINHRKTDKGDQHNRNIKEKIKPKIKDVKNETNIKKVISKYIPKTEGKVCEKIRKKENNSSKQKNEEGVGGWGRTNERQECCIKGDGNIQKCVFRKDGSVILRSTSYDLDANEALLTLYDLKNEKNKKLYYILSAKEISFNDSKHDEMFQLKVKKTNKDIITDLILKTRSVEEKRKWIDEFGIKINLVNEILKMCIEEIEIRRFRKGQKKRNEVKELKEVDVSTLLRAIETSKTQKIKLTDEKRWNISRIEKLIQVILTEMSQPLIPFNLQEILDKSPPQKSFQKEYAKILKKLPTINHTMLVLLMEHLEKLTIYYGKELNVTNIEVDKIRQNICSRLTPLIIRQELNKDDETVNSFVGNDSKSLHEKFCIMFAKMMETTNIRK